MNAESPGETLAPPHVDDTMKSIPDAIAVPPGNEVFLVTQGLGTQNYICLPSATGFDWALFTPQATLFDDEGRQVVTHYFSPSPPESDPTKLVPTWQANDDTSVWAAKDASVPGSGWRPERPWSPATTWLGSLSPVKHLAPPFLGPSEQFGDALSQGVRPHPAQSDCDDHALVAPAETHEPYPTLGTALRAGRPKVHLGDDGPALTLALAVGPCPARLRAEGGRPPRPVRRQRIGTAGCGAAGTGRDFVTRRNAGGAPGRHRLLASSSAASISLSPEG